jgi:NAD-dependent SIR2 family protein deacetylase
MAEGFDVHDSAAQLAEILAAHARTLVLTGAGLSTASGIPDYRDRDGVRRGRQPIQGPEFRRSQAVQCRYWARSMVGWPVLAQARPNAGHDALAALEAAGHLGALLTQNVDGLHQRAGSHAVLELHGNIHSVVCLACRT